MTDVQIWACTYVGGLDPSFASLGEAERLEENLFTSGRIDSMGLMNLLLDAEAEFDFAFTPEAFQDRRLHTIRGLSEVVAELKASA